MAVQKLVELKTSSIPEIYQSAKQKSWGNDIESFDTYVYHNETGKIVGYVCRFNLKTLDSNGKKDKQFLQARRSNGRVTMRGIGGAVYNLWQATRSVENTLVLVEGEKSCLALQDYFEANKLPYTAITVAGGSGQFNKIDFSALLNRNIIMWPDKDQVGIKAMQHASRGAQDNNLKVLGWVNIQSAWGKGYDAADAIADGLDVAEIVNKFVAFNSAEHLVGDEANTAKDLAHYAFKVLGYGVNDYVYIQSNTDGVVRSIGTKFDTNKLITIYNNIDFWKSFAGVNSKEGVNEVECFSRLWEMAQEKGMYDVRKSKQFGIFEDKGRIVANIGTSLIVDGQPCSFGDFDGEATYQACIAKQDFNPAVTRYDITDDERRILIEAIMESNIGVKQQRKCILGWIISSVLAGLDHKRPHIWIQGPFGSGKSFMTKDTINELILGGIAAEMSGSKSTIAGLKQTIGGRASPLIWDEANFQDSTFDISTPVFEKLKEILKISYDNNEQNGMAQGNQEKTGDVYLPRFSAMFSSVDFPRMDGQVLSRVIVIPVKTIDDLNVRAEIRKSYSMKYFIPLKSIEHLPSKVWWFCYNHARDFVKNHDNIVAWYTERRFDARIISTIAPLLAGYVTLKHAGVPDDLELEYDLFSNKDIELLIENRSEKGTQDAIDFVVRLQVRFYEPLSRTYICQTLADFIQMIKFNRTYDDKFLMAQQEFRLMGVDYDNETKRLYLGRDSKAIEKQLRQNWEAGIKSMVSYELVDRKIGNNNWVCHSIVIDRL